MAHIISVAEASKDIYQNEHLVFFGRTSCIAFSK